MARTRQIKHRHGLGFVLVLAGLLCTAAGAGAQSVSRAQVPVDRKQQIAQAERLVRQGRAPEALPILEMLHRRYPDDPRVLLALASAHLHGGNQDSAIVLLRTAAEERGERDPNLWVQLSRFHRRAGDGRAAVAALLRCIDQRPIWAERLRDRFELLVADSTVGDSALAALEEAALPAEAGSAYKELLAHVYAIGGRTAEALRLVMEVDRAQSGRGRVLFPLARTLSGRSEPSHALAAFDSVLALEPRPDLAQEVWFEKARLLATRGRAAEAVAAYTAAEEQLPRGPLGARAALARAELIADELGDLAAARAVFVELLRRIDQQPRAHRQQSLRDQARLGLADCALRQEDFDAAGERYGELERGASRAEIRERAAFEQAEILFFAGGFDEAEEAYYQLSDRYPQGVWVNDALQRVLLLGERRGARGLEDLARVLYLRRVGRREEALAVTREALGAAGETPLAPELYLQATQLCGELDRAAQADSALGRLLGEHPESRAAPAALLWLGNLLAQSPAGRDRAREYYERILLEYPRAFEARRARAMLRVLMATEDQS